MSSHKARKKLARQLASQSGIIGVPSSYFGGAGSGFSAGDDDPSMRGKVYFPNLDSRTVLRSHTRTEAMRNARWLEVNMGIGRHIATTVPRLIGPLIPQARTKDDKFNEAAEAHFLRTQGSAIIHDEAGVEDFFTRQRTVLRRGTVDGDGILVRTTTSTGNARTILYEAPQIGQGNYSAEKGWYDGVKMSKYGLKLAYAIRDLESFNDFTVIDARNVMHFGNFESPRAPRGLTRYAHAAARLFDVREIDNDTLRGIKAAGLFGIVIQNEILGNLNAAPAAGRIKTKAFTGIPNTNVPSPKAIKYEELTEPGGSVANLGIGQKASVLHDARPHPNQRAMIDYMIMDIAWGLGLPPALLWSPEGLTGPAVRFIMRMAQKTLDEERDRLKRQFCQPYWNYTLALAMKNGQIPWCKDPDWWKCEWIAPCALTIDAGRDATANREDVKGGLRSRSTSYGEESKDWESELWQIGKEHAKVKEIEKTYGLEPGTIFGERELNQVQPEAPTP